MVSKSSPGKDVVYRLLLILVVCTSTSWADSEYRTKYSFDAKAIKTNYERNMGWLAGVRYGRYLGDSPVNIGVVGYFGFPMGMNPTTDYLMYVGGYVEWEKKVNSIVFHQASLVVGYAEGRYGSRNPPVHERSYFTAEPTYAFGFFLGQGWRILGQTSYLHQNTNKNFCGLTFGLRFEYKIRTMIKAMNE